MQCRACGTVLYKYVLLIANMGFGCAFLDLLTIMGIILVIHAEKTLVHPDMGRSDSDCKLVCKDSLMSLANCRLIHKLWSLKENRRSPRTQYCLVQVRNVCHIATSKYTLLTSYFLAIICIRHAYWTSLFVYKIYLPENRSILDSYRQSGRR